ncbi:MAG TPA: HIT domain-containing protein [Ignavibacteriaceae bacterium]|nr:HIT domain-containing protein [Ignavibacteriaceae bacterium]
MEKLWSPWRSKYIESFKSDEDKTKCIFCQMLSFDPNDDDNLLVDMGEHTFTVMNLYPYNNGHLMIVPKRHTNDFAGLKEVEVTESFQKLQLAEKALRKVLNPNGFNIGANIGRVAGAGIEDHIHFHIVPRWNGDSNFMPVIGDVKVISQDLAETKAKLLQAYLELKQ